MLECIFERFSQCIARVGNIMTPVPASFKTVCCLKPKGISGNTCRIIHSASQDQPKDRKDPPMEG